MTGSSVDFLNQTMARGEAAAIGFRVRYRLRHASFFSTPELAAAVLPNFSFLGGSAFVISPNRTGIFRKKRSIYQTPDASLIVGLPSCESFRSLGLAASLRHLG